jgi:hypothetical protein
MLAGKSDPISAKGARELYTYKMIVVKMRYPDCLGLHDPRTSPQTVSGTDGSARNLQ